MLFDNGQRTHYSPGCFKEEGIVNSSFVVWMNSKEDDALRVSLLQWDGLRKEKRGFPVGGGIESLCDNCDVLNSLIDCLSVGMNETCVE